MILIEWNEELEFIKQELTLVGTAASFAPPVEGRPGVVGLLAASPCLKVGGDNAPEEFIVGDDGGLLPAVPEHGCISALGRHFLWAASWHTDGKKMCQYSKFSKFEKNGDLVNITILMYQTTTYSRMQR